MNNKNERQHYVSQVLLKRFKATGKSLQCYQIQTGLWKAKRIERACSARGYNQLLVGGNMNNTIEDSFSKVETNPPRDIQSIADRSKSPNDGSAKRNLRELVPLLHFLVGNIAFRKAGGCGDFFDAN